MNFKYKSGLSTVKVDIKKLIANDKETKVVLEPHKVKYFKQTCVKETSTINLNML